ncbi:MFS transporter [Cysteiniphilum litorale]|uniref:MFS transporter n=1 Tax=Cysteiniphilum litorale TaxID=2056700 RepID=UPI003F8803A4
MSNKYKPYSPLILLLFGTFLTSLSYWMTWPFLAIILSKNHHLTASTIGAILSLSVIVSTIVSIYIAYIADKYGRFNLMVCGCILAIVAYIFLSYSNSISQYVISISLVSLSRSVLEPLGKAIFTDFMASPSSRANALQIRYFIVNLGAGIGPLIAVSVGFAAQQTTFLVTAASFFIFLLLLTAIKNGAKGNHPPSETGRPSKINFMSTLKIILNDKVFLILVIVNILLWVVFVQFESSIALFFAITNLPDMTDKLSTLIAINTFIIVIFQLPLVKVLSKVGVSTRIYIGLVILSASQIIFALATIETFTVWVIAVVIFSIAEMILVPNISIQTDMISSSHLKSSYFAISSLYRVGLGAYIGGIFLHYSTAFNLFIFMFLLCAATACLYFSAQRELHLLNIQKSN